MPKLRILSGKKIIKILNIFGFTVIKQKGSHIKLLREVSKTRQILTIPNHTEISKGTLREIYSQSLKYISENELRVYFFQ